MPSMRGHVVFWVLRRNYRCKSALRPASSGFWEHRSLTSTLFALDKAKEPLVGDGCVLLDSFQLFAIASITTHETFGWFESLCYNIFTRTGVIGVEDRSLAVNAAVLRTLPMSTSAAKPTLLGLHEYDAHNSPRGRQ